MPQTFTEGQLTFAFPDNWTICRPEQTSYYKRHFQSFCGGCKEMDFLAWDPQTLTLWFIEVKDYRVHQRLKQVELPREVAEKVRDSLALVRAGQVRDQSVGTTSVQIRMLAQVSSDAGIFRVILHCELPKSASRLFPGVKLSANLQQKLRQELRSVDRHAAIRNKSMSGNLPWTVT